MSSTRRGGTLKFGFGFLKVAILDSLFRFYQILYHVLCSQTVLRSIPSPFSLYVLYCLFLLTVLIAQYFYSLRPIFPQALDSFPFIQLLMQSKPYERSTNHYKTLLAELCTYLKLSALAPLFVVCPINVSSKDFPFIFCMQLNLLASFFRTTHLEFYNNFINMTLAS